MDSDLLEQAVAHIRAGRPADARRLLAQLLDKDPHNEAAWFWLVETMPTAEQRISVLQQCLRFNPQSRPARLGLDKLTTQHQTPSAQPPAPTSPAESSAQPSQSPGMLSRMKPPAETNQPPAGQKPPEPEEDLFASLRQPAASEEDFFANLRQPSEQQQEPEPEGDLFASLRQPAASEEDFFANLRQPSEQQQEPEPKGDYFASLRPPAELEDHLFSALIASTEPEPKSSFQEPLPPPSRKDFPALEERVFLEDAPSQRGSKESADKGPTQKKDEVVDEAASIEPVELKDLQELRKKGRRRIPIWRYLLPPFGLVLLLAGLYLFFAYDVPSQLREVPFVARVFFPTATLTPTPTLTPTVTNTPSPTPTRTPRPSITPTFTPSPTLPPEYGVGQIIFSSSRSIRTIDLFLVNADGSGLSNLTADRMAPDNHPDWSPDGSQIVFESEDEIFVMTLPDGRPVNLTNDPARDFQPDWSPDGNDIVFVSNRTESSEIYIMRSNGSGVTLVPTLNTAKFWPAWSPDGTQIVFAALQDGNFDLYIVNRDGSSLRRLTNTPHSEITPAWSPDGSSIAFASNQDRNNNIFVIDASGGEPLRLTDNNFDDEFPAWSPDGRWIVFSTGREGRDTTSLFVMRSDGSDQTLLIQTSAIDIEPAWIR